MSALTRFIWMLRFRAARDPRKRAELFAKRGVIMGSGCMIFSGVAFGSEPYLVSLGNNVKVTSGVRFVTHDGGIHVLRGEEDYAQADLFEEICVGNNVFIGVDTIILPGVSIGDNVIIGAGSTVTRDIPSNSVSGGVPCRVIKTLDEYRDAVRSRVIMTKGWTASRKRTFLIEKFRGGVTHLS